jgi:hypothetical protein
MTTLGVAQFQIMFAESRTAFRLEHQREPLAEEQEAFQYWQQGNEMVPWEWPPWRNWLDLAWRHTSGGTAEIRRVRLVDDPPTRYQQWAIAITSWHEQAGDHIRYMPCQLAEQLGIPIANWWLFDDTHVVAMTYDGGKEPGKILISDSEAVAKYRTWRDLAVANATEPVPL